jgi:hypothetical protein
VNRSRPIYEPAPRRGRRPGGPARRFERPGTGLPGTGRGGDAGRGPNAGGGQPFEEKGLPPLPSNPREAALRILHAADTRSAFSDRMLDRARARRARSARPGAHARAGEGHAALARPARLVA